MLKSDNNHCSLPGSLWQFYIKFVIRKYKWIILLWMLTTVLVSMGEIIDPIVQRWIVALFETPIPEGTSFISFALPSLIYITMLNLIITCSSLLKDTIYTRWKPQSKNTISEILTNYVHNQSMHFFTGRMAGSINSQIGYIQNGLMVIGDSLRCICELFMICINAGLLFTINKYVAIIFGFTFIFRVIFAYGTSKSIKLASEENSTANSSLSGKIVDSISNYSIVKLFTGSSKEEKLLYQPRMHAIQTIINLNYKIRLFWAIPGILSELLFGVTILCCIYLYTKGVMTIADIVYTMSVYSMVIYSISTLIDRFPNIIDEISSAKKAYNELVVPIEVLDKADATELQITKGIIKFNNVSFKYNNKLVLNNLSLVINSGERVGIVGSSGAGKTTLVNLLMRLYDVTKGSITIDNQNIQNVSQTSLRENISFIPQDPTMFNRTIKENIAYAKDNASFTEIRSAAKKASADKFIMATEHQYDSTVGDKGIKLSGGQKQRIAIARAFLKNAPILILDEATSALDSETEIAIQKSFDKLSKGKTTIAIAHRLSTLRNMDRIIVLERGHIVEQGTHQKLLRQKGIYSRLWKMQSGGFLQDKSI